MTAMQKVLYLVSVFGNLLFLILWMVTGHTFFMAMLVLTIIYSVVGFYDLCNSAHTLNRLYPVVAHIRYFLESYRVEIHQYFVANNTEELPFNREQRSLVYQRAKGEIDTKAFGTERDIFQQNYLCAWHSLAPKEVHPEHIRVMVGGKECRKPYSCSRLNVSAMSYGALSQNAIEALNKGAAKGDFFHNTGEGGVSPFHLKHGGNLVWQLGTAFFGCRDIDGNFSDRAFSELANQGAIKMIEIKLSQGAKPAHGGVLPAAKISDEIARIRGIPKDRDCISPPVNSLCRTPIDLLNFVKRLRELSGGKPVGFKFCMGNPAEFLAICKAMLKTGISPDFISVDGAEGGTGAAPVEFSNRLGMGCLEATYIAHNALIGCGLRNEIRIISSGKTASGFDLLTKVAFGADIVSAARTMMFALGCIQSQSCNTNYCPTGIATQDPARSNALNVESKSERVKNFQKATVDSFLELVGAMGLENPDQLQPFMIRRRNANGLNFEGGLTFPPLTEGALINEEEPDDEWSMYWQAADANSFTPKELLKFSSGGVLPRNLPN